METMYEPILATNLFAATVITFGTRSVKMEPRTSPSANQVNYALHVTPSNSMSERMTTRMGTN